MKLHSRLLIHLTLAAVFLMAPHAGAGFHRVAVGDVIENVELPTLSGGTQHLLGEAEANVFVFFKPGQEHSRTTLVHLAELEREFAGKPVRWAAVTSDRAEPAEIAADVRAAGLTMPVLIDTGDKLYGQLGVAVRPNIGITDSRHQLVADLPFSKVNYTSVIRGHIRHQLGEISDAELQAVLNPPAATQGGNGAVARRHLNYAERLFQAGQPEQALEQVRKSLETDPDLAAAHELKARILTELGRPDDK